MAEECVYIAKGPTAGNALSHIQGRDVATVNEACLIVPGKVKYGIFYDYEQLMASRPAWGRIETFVFPEHYLHICFGRFAINHTEIPGIKNLNFTTFHPRITQDLAFMRKIIEQNNENEIVVRNTSVAGLHWLVKMAGYRRLHLFGHDGGEGYSPRLSLDPGWGYDDVHQATLFVAERLREKFQAEIIFHKGEA